MADKPKTSAKGTSGEWYAIADGGWSPTDRLWASPCWVARQLMRDWTSKL